MVSAIPRDDVNPTLFPLTGLPNRSNRVTVIVEVATPSAVTVAGLAVTVETAAATGPTFQVTFVVGACAASLVLPVVPATASVTVIVTGPSAC
jgi:hypothetical protein